MMLRALVLSLLLAGPALGACPAVPDRSGEMDALIAEARRATTEAAGRAVMGRMWDVWTDAPDAPAQELLDQGMAALRVGDGLRALDALDRLVAYCPDFAEGWNQRAFVHFLAGRMEAARADLTAALARDPRHAAALSGLALTLIRLGEDAAAQDALRRAVAVNPWIPERALLEGGVPQEL